MTNADSRNAAPIGVFDSGVGGLSVLRDIRTELPAEDLLFVADSLHVPYGNKSPEAIVRRAVALSRFLLEQGAKVIVVACNTATAAAAERLRATLTVPVVAMEPAVKPAAEATKNGVVGVLATVGTLESARLAALLARFAQDIEVVTQPAPGLVEQVEAGDLDGVATRALVEKYTRPLLSAGADTIVLGCTHYPFLKRLLREVVGPSVALIDTGTAVARELRRVLNARDLLAASASPGREQFWTSGDARIATGVVSLLWKRSVEVASLPADFL